MVGRGGGLENGWVREERWASKRQGGGREGGLKMAGGGGGKGGRRGAGGGGGLKEAGWGRGGGFKVAGRRTTRAFRRKKTLSVRQRRKFTFAWAPVGHDQVVIAADAPVTTDSSSCQT